MASAVTLMLAFASCAFAQSSRPPETQQDDAAAKRQQEGIDQLRSLATELKAIREQQTRTEQREAANEASQGDPFGPPTWPNWVLAAFAAIAAILAARSLRAVEQQAVETAKAATAARTSADALLVAERAYVGLSLPVAPPYDPQHGQKVGGLIVKGDAFNIDKLWRIPARELRDILNAANSFSDDPLRLFVFGYVDYIDQFGSRRRAGYGRFYNPLADERSHYLATSLASSPPVDEDAYRRRNNLPFITQPGYNYDRERVKGEGDDWNEN